VKIAIVGGGITGVSIAYFLSQNNVDITVFEKSPRLGGLLGSFRIGHVWLEKYFHHIFLSDTAIRKLIADIGLGPELFWKTTPMGFYISEKIYAFDKPLDLLRFSALSWLDRFRFGFQILRSGRNKDGLELDAITVQEWVTQAWSKDIYDQFWHPLLKGKFGDAANQISAAWLWGRIHARANSRAGGQEKLGYLRGGFVRIFERLAQVLQSKSVTLHLHTEVSKVEKTSSHKWLVSSKKRSKEFANTFDCVILALPSPLILSLCGDIPKEEQETHASISYQAILCMTLVMNRPLSPIYWLNVADSSIPFSGIIEHTNFIPKDDYDGSHTAYLFNYLPQNHAWLSETKSQIFERYERGLQHIFPYYQRAHVKNTILFRDPYATPIYDVGYLKKMPPVSSSQKGLFYANTAHIFPHDRNMNFSVELAKRVVDKVLT